MDAVRFCELAPLLGAYTGAVAARALRERSENDPAPTTARPAPSSSLIPPGATEIPSTQAAVRMSPMAGLFSFATSGG